MRGEELHVEVEKLFAWLDASPPQIDPATFGEPSSGPDAPGYVSGDEVVTRLQGV